jgi:hypothetical protein
MKIIFSSLLFLCLSFVLFSQNDGSVPTWVEHADSVYKPDNFTYQTVRNCKKKQDVVKLKEEFTEELKKRLASNIYTSIDSKRRLTTNETKINNQFIFTGSSESDVSMQSKVDLTQYQVLDFFDKKEKKLHLIIVQNKEKLKNAYDKNIRRLLYDIDGEASQRFQDKRTDEIVRAKKQLEVSLRSIADKINFFGFLVDVSDNRADQFQQRLTELRLQVSDLSGLINDKSFEEDYARAQQLFNEGNCKGSYSEVQRLLIRNSSDERVIGLRDKVVECQTREMENAVHDAYAKKQYEKCLTIYESLIRLNSKYDKDEHFIELRDKAFRDYISDKFNKVENCIDLDIRKAENILNSIKWFGLPADDYKSKYDDFDTRIKTKVNEQLELEFKNHINNKKFREAHAAIVEISGNSINNDIKDVTLKLKKQWESEATSYLKKLLLKNRPHLYSMKFGLSFLTNSISNAALENANVWNTFKENSDYLYPYYSFALYRKFNIKTKFSQKSHRDKSSSYLIGLKLGLQDYSNAYKISEPDDSLFSINNNLNYELQLSSLVLRCFNLNYGVFFDRTGLANINLYSATFGLKIPIWRFDFDLNAKYISDYKSEHHFLVEGGISLNLNFKKKFVQSDRDQLKLNIQKFL